MSDDPRPEIMGIHHIKLPVSDLARSLDFYERLMGAARIPAFDHKNPDGSVYAYICDVPGLGTKMELRLNPKHAEAQRRFDPITIAVKDRAMLGRWIARLDALGIDHSKEIVAIQAWLVTFDDPDQHRLRLYTLETHGPELSPDVDDPWLGN